VKKLPKRGFLLIAFNNDEIDYIKMACSCALSIKSHLNNNHTTLITESTAWLEKILSKEQIEKVFDNIILVDAPNQKNVRTHYDSPWTKFKAPFLNNKRSSAYELSPYEETILLDVDYMVMGDSLDLVWGCDDDFLINKDATSLRNEKFHDKEIRLSKTGIPMYWATLIYFKKSELAKRIFDLTIFIKEHYLFYKHLYKFPGKLFRNDYVFSIAIHIISGFINSDINSFPIPTIKTMDQKDDIVEIEFDHILFLSHDPEQPWVNHLVKLQNIDVHIMNKRSFLRQYEQIIKLFLR
jgi:hypothetical protein